MVFARQRLETLAARESIYSCSKNYNQEKLVNCTWNTIRIRTIVALFLPCTVFACDAPLAAEKYIGI
jgi:hypothetical protein